MRLVPSTSADELATVAGPVGSGRVLRATGIVVEAMLPRVAIGTGCDVETSDGRSVSGEVVGFSGPAALLMLLGDMRGVAEGCLVRPRGRLAQVPVGDALLGRIVDPNMVPVDGGPPVRRLPEAIGLDNNPPAAMTRRRISEVLPTGVRCLDTLLTVGEGQRLGIMAGPGVGKSVLMGMLARAAQA